MSGGLDSEHSFLRPLVGNQRVIWRLDVYACLGEMVGDMVRLVPNQNHNKVSPHLFAGGRSYRQLVKNATPMKCNEAKCNKMRCACISRHGGRFGKFVFPGQLEQE